MYLVNVKLFIVGNPQNEKNDSIVSLPNHKNGKTFENGRRKLSISKMPNNYFVIFQL